MRLIPSLIRAATAAVFVLGLAACSTTAGDSSTLLIDQPTAPFPYNSRFCP